MQVIHTSKIKNLFPQMSFINRYNNLSRCLQGPEAVQKCSALLERTKIDREQKD